jgi:uroporphyrinogen decarboxylase
MTTETMTSRDIILANINHAPVDRCGMTFHRGRLNDFCGAGPRKPFDEDRRIQGDKEYYSDIWGNRWVRMVNGSFKGEVCQPVLTDWSQLDDLEIPDFDRQEYWAEAKQRLSEHPDTFRSVSVGGWVFDQARYLRKLEVYLMDMALYPEELETLHQKVARMHETKIRWAAWCGADAITIGEDMGTQQGLLFSPEMWRHYFKDLYSRLFGMAHELGMKVLMHSCGQNWAILGDLLEAGVDGFQFDQPAVYDMPALADLLSKHQAALWSPVDIQRVLPTGDETYIRAETRKMCEIFQGGLICKNYPDLGGIGIDEQWDQWAYEEICTFFDIDG